MAYIKIKIIKLNASKIGQDSYGLALSKSKYKVASRPNNSIEINLKSVKLDKLKSEKKTIIIISN